MRDEGSGRTGNAGPQVAGIPRRDFLVFVGAGAAAVGLASVRFRSPEERVVPRFELPEEATPGVALWYASTCGACPAACGMLVKTRDGRPVKLEGNPEHPLSRGGLCARGQASLLDLYDASRLRGPLAAGAPAAWDAVDAGVTAGLARAAEAGRGIRILTPTVTSPSLLAAIEAFAAAHPGTRHVVHDALSASSIREAHRRTHGEARLPWFRFDRAKVIVSFDADFLGTWISPVEFARDWSVNRNLGEGRRLLSRHIQYEARVSATGAAADTRIPLRPSGLPAAVLELAAAVARRVGSPLASRLPAPAAPSGVSPAATEGVAGRLAADAGRTLVVCGSGDPGVQVLVNLLNEMLGNYGNTLDLGQPSLQGACDDGAVDDLLAEMERGEVGALLLLGSNPVYDHPRGAAFRAAMAKVGLVVSTAGLRDESAAVAGFVCPAPDPLESWGDAHPHVGVYSVCQPVIAPLHDTRPPVESLLLWARSAAPVHDWMRKVWRERILPLQERFTGFEELWGTALRDGVLVAAGERLSAPAFDPSAIPADAPAAPATPPGELELVVHASAALGDGRQAFNPWLQELPDPLSRTTWGNGASLSPATARSLGVVEGRVVELAAGGSSVRLPVLLQPGMPDGVVAAPLGYGRDGSSAIHANYPVVKMLPVEREDAAGADLHPLRRARTVRVVPTDRMEPHAKVQTFDRQTAPGTDEHRRIARQTTFAAWAAAAGAEPAGKGEGAVEGATPSLWPAHDYPGRKWAMTVDLTACTGCAACVVACQAENNVPVVGRAEVRKSRDMAWLRIDRYYEGAGDEAGDILFQPMLCHHCDNAPCETVCPALATLHSGDGLNMQVYNRCVGTRYCANNCPYKVRRFNWFDYARADEIQNLVLNPDVTVRSRGVMEKCSFCVQRIADGRRTARAEGREPLDGEIQPACAQSCPTRAIVFGDSNDPRSRVSATRRDRRAYAVLEDIGVGPAVRYLERVRNREEGA